MEEGGMEEGGMEERKINHNMDQFGDSLRFSVLRVI